MGIGHEVRRLSASHLDAVRLLAWSTLPARPTSFVGRTDECAQVVAAGFDSRHQSWPKFDHVPSRDLDLAGADVDALEVAWEVEVDRLGDGRLGDGRPRFRSWRYGVS